MKRVTPNKMQKHKKFKKHHNAKTPSIQNFLGGYKRTRWTLTAALIVLLIIEAKFARDATLRSALKWVIILLSIWTSYIWLRFGLWKVNRLNLNDDLKFYTMKILACVGVCAAVFFFFTSFIAYAINGRIYDGATVTVGAYAAVIAILSAFALFRAKRRFKLVGIWN